MSAVVVQKKKTNSCSYLPCLSCCVLRAVAADSCPRVPGLRREGERERERESVSVCECVCVQERERERERGREIERERERENNRQRFADRVSWVHISFIHHPPLGHAPLELSRRCPLRQGCHARAGKGHCHGRIGVLVRGHNIFPARKLGFGIQGGALPPPRIAPASRASFYHWRLECQPENSNSNSLILVFSYILSIAQLGPITPINWNPRCCHWKQPYTSSNPYSPVIFSGRHSALPCCIPLPECRACIVR